MSNFWHVRLRAFPYTQNDSALRCNLAVFTFWGNATRGEPGYAEDLLRSGDYLARTLAAAGSASLRMAFVLKAGL